MQKMWIPKTDLMLSPIGLGTARAGLDWDGAEADRIFDCYLALGGNFIDTARGYSDWVPPEVGRSERVIGDWLRRSGKRNAVVLATKGGLPDLKDMHTARMNEGQMRQDLELSLKTLGTDYIDLYFYHRDDPDQPVEESVEIMERFRQEGKIRYYGCSNWTAERIAAAQQYCREKGYIGFVADEAMLNMATEYMLQLRDDTQTVIKGDLYEYHCRDHSMLAVPYMGIARGFFHLYAAGGKEAVEGNQYYSEGNLRRAEYCVELAKLRGVTITQVVLGWLLDQPFPSLPLYGPMDTEQLTDAMETLQVYFSEEDFANMP